jgi:peptidoglycan/xylan/chitin deacetylase (PgdA/CDA1 family)
MSEPHAASSEQKLPASASPPAQTPFTVRLPKEASPFARWRSRAVRAIVAKAAPKSVLVTRGPVRRGERQIALTFDDGPDEMTARYLDCLDSLGVRATFFLIGENAFRAPDAVLEYVRRGHEVAGHGYRHEPFPAMGAAELVDELARTQDLLPASRFARPLVRPPLGRVSARSIVAVAAAGFTTILWSLDSDDCRTRDPAVVAARVHPDHVAPGEIVLLHELQPWTLEALPAIVEGLRAAGYALVTVGEMLG